MREIGYSNVISTLVCSAFLGVFISGITLYFARPDTAAVNSLPTINYDNINLYKSQVIGSSPFGLRQNSDLNVMDMPAAPTPPSVPSMPAASGSTGSQLTVIGLLPPDVCILQKGGITVTARSDSDTELGHVGSINDDGVYVDGKYLRIK